ncbi:MAG: hypothetical protein ACTSRU_09875 [Candidatus Hodarchaeales archaeon]
MAETCPAEHAIAHVDKPDESIDLFASTVLNEPSPNCCLRSRWASSTGQRR